MRIGTIEAGSGEKAFGFFGKGETRGRFPVQVPLHVVRGAGEGPVLLVQAGVSGLEIEPAMILPQVVRELDPTRMAGTLLLVPLFNTSGFEFEQEEAIWDGKDLHTLGRGRPDGSVSERMIDAYYREVVTRADAVVDVRTGAQWGYFRYAGVYPAGDVDRSRAMAAALGLPHVLLGQPEDASIASEAARDGKAVVSAWIGGGPGLRDHREEDLGRVRAAVLNALRHLGILDGEVERDGGPPLVLQGHTIVRHTGERGLIFMAKELRATEVQAGERIGYVRHPFTGAVVEEIAAPRAGVMLHAGAAWPVVPEGATLAILGDPVDAPAPG